MSNTCTCEATEILIFPCSGGSNVGQIANQAGVDLTRAGVGKLYCLAGIGGHLDSFIESAKAARRIVAIDGCQACCAKKTLEHAGFNVTDHVVATDLGIKKNHDFNLLPEDINMVCSDIRRQLGR
ncbi:MAG: putative zinc-binding protein [Peptococcaceae bacterium]|nr:putative zinc-binding protein [Peptococcaceae bacterium]